MLLFSIILECLLALVKKSQIFSLFLIAGNVELLYEQV